MLFTINFIKNCIEETKIKENRPGMTQLKNCCFLLAIDDDDVEQVLHYSFLWRRHNV